MNQSDPHFTDFVRHGSEAAFEELVTRHMGMVHSAARRLLGTRADGAADVAQTVFAQLARRARSLPQDLVVSAWLHRATIRTALNFLRTESRREARERAAADLMETNNASDDFSEAEAAAVNAALMPHIDRAIGELPEIDRQALTLCYFEKCRQQEIGERLGLSADAVQKRLSRALAKLRHRLTRRGITLSAAGLTLWLTDHSVQAAPVSLSASALTAGALETAAHGTAAGGGFFQLLVMANIKSIAIGTALGLVGGSLWAMRAGDPTTAAHTTPRPAAAPFSSAMEPGGGTGGAAARQRFTVPEPARTPEGLMDQLRTLITGPDNEITRQRVAAWLAEVPTGLFEPLINLAYSRLSRDEKRRWLPNLAAAWGKKDPVGAVLALSAMFTGDYYLGSKLAGSAFQAWHESSPAEALRWMVEHQDDPQLTETLPRIVSAVAESLAAVSSDRALRWAAQLEGDDLREAALSPLCEKLKAAKDQNAWREVCGSLLKNSDPGFQRLALKQVMAGWCAGGLQATETRAAANSWLASLPPSPEKGLAAECLVGSLLNPQRFPEDLPPTLLSALKESDPRSAADSVTSAIRQAPRALTPATREALLTMIPETERGAVIEQAARKLSSEAVPYHLQDLPKAIQWAAELKDAAVRDSLVKSISRQWQDQYRSGKNDHDPAQWKEAAELPKEVQDLLRNALREPADGSNP